MSKPVNKTLIGIFVLGAVALAIGAILIFGSGKFFTPMKKYVMFFGGSVKGLKVGSPVIFRGVTIGEVTDIQLQINLKDLAAAIPVYIEIDPRKITVPENANPLSKETERRYVYIQPLIEKGLKSQLQMQSFVTGQLMINLDFYLDKPTKFVGLEKKYPEIPTIPTGIEELTKTLQDLKLSELYEKIMITADGISKIVNSPEIMKNLSSLNKTLNDVDRIVNNLDKNIGPLVENLKSTSDAARGALANIEKSFSMEDGIPAQVGETLKTTNKTLQQTEKTIASIQTIAQDNASIGYELNRTLKELSESARSIRFLADYLERHPESLIRGKGSFKGE